MCHSVGVRCYTRDDGGLKENPGKLTLRSPLERRLLFWRSRSNSRDRQGKTRYAPAHRHVRSVARGEEVYFRNCSLCHGVSGEVRGGLFPDLRRSFATGTAEAFRAVVLEGALEQNGMRSFSEVLTAEDAEAARAYIVSLARRAQAAEQR
jgi:mono/diheme cytochrome c family protein